MTRGMLWSVLLASALLATTSRAEPLEMEILTEWNGQPVDHLPVSVTLDSSSDDVLELVVQAPFFDDPAPPAPANSSFIGLWDYEVVEIFLLNDADQYLQVELSPHGQYFALLFDGERNYKRFSLPLAVSSVITGDADPSWTATAQIPTDYLPFQVTKVNAYATHGASGDRRYEAYSPAPSTATAPDYHKLEYFAPINLDTVIPDLSSRPMSELWRDAVLGLIRYSIEHFWNGVPIEHAPVVITLGGNEEEVILSVSAPFFDDPAPDALPGEPLNGLWNYEVVEAFFLNDENQYLELEVGPHGQHLDLLLWTQDGEYNQMRHSLPMTYSSVIDRDNGIWTGTAIIPVDYLPPKVTRFNAYCKHIPGDGRHEESLYPQDPTDEVADFHALQYFRPIDLNSVVPGQSERPMSQLWQDTIQGIFRYEVTKEWNSVPTTHAATVFTLEGFEAGVELNITAPFYNDPAPGGTPGEPFYGLWDYEVVEMFFLNDNEEYLEVELGPWGEHLLLMLKGQRNAIKHSLPLDYVVTARVNGTAPQPGMWQASALIPPSYFPPNVSRVNAYAIHGTGDDKQYEALYPAPLDDPNYPQPDFHALELFQKMDFEFLVVDNSQYSDLWLEAIENSTTAAPAPVSVVGSIGEEFTRSSVPEVNVETNELVSIETTTVASEEMMTTTSATTEVEVTVTGSSVEGRSSLVATEPVPVEDEAVDVPIDELQIENEVLDAVPVEETSTPVEEASVPVEDASAPVEEASAPVEDASAPVEDVSAPVEDASTPVEDISSGATAKDADQTDAELAYESTTVQDSSTTVFDFEATTILPRADEEEYITTIIPETTTAEISRDIGVPQPELVKEARRQDVEKPTGNLFRPIPARAPPRTPHPTKLDEKSDVMTPFVRPNVPFSNQAFGIVQPHFSHQPLFPPPSFFNPNSQFSRPTFPSPSQTAYINGQPVAIQGETESPLPPKFNIRDHTFSPLSPYLNHLLHQLPQREQVSQQEPSHPLSTSPHQQLDLLQETNEVLPDRLYDSEIASSHTGTETGHPVLGSQDTALPASSIQHSVPQVQQVHLEANQENQPQVHSHVIEQEDSLPMVQEGPIDNPVRPIIGSQTPTTQPQLPVQPILQPQIPFVQPQQPVQPIISEHTPLVEPQQPLQPVISHHTPFMQPQLPVQPIIEPKQPVQPIIQPKQPVQPIIQPKQPVQPIIQPKQPVQPIIQPKQPVQPIIQPKQPVQPIIQPKQPVQPIIQPKQPVQPTIQPKQPVQPIIQPKQPVQPIIQPQQSLQSTQPETNVEPQQSIVEQPITPIATPRPLAPLLPTIATQRPLAPAPPAPSPPSLGRPGVIPPTATPHRPPSPSARYNCQTQGLHSDPILCPIFHECVLENNQWEVYTWRCPRGKYFDDVTLTCVSGFC